MIYWIKWQTRVVIMEPSIAGFFRKVNEAENLFGRLAMTGGVWYSPSLPLADAKWSLLRLHFFSICAICSVFMRSLEF